MKTTNEFLKEITKVKNSKGIELASIQIWEFIDQNDLKNENLLKCIKRICTYISFDKKITAIEQNRIEHLLYQKIDDIKVKYEYYLCLSDLYFELAEYEKAYQMARGAISSILENDYEKVYKLRNCYFKQAQILNKNKLNRPKDNITGFLDLLKSRIYEVIGEINSSLMGAPERIKKIEETFFTNYDFEIELYDTFLSDFQILDKKSIIENEILNFINFDVLKSMNISINNEENLTKEYLKNNCYFFEDDEIIYRFCDEIAIKYVLFK